MRKRKVTIRGLVCPAWCVVALLNGKASVIRRPCLVQPAELDGLWQAFYPWGEGGHGIYESAAELRAEFDGLIMAHSRYGDPGRGDQLKVRETFYCDHYQYPNGPRQEMIDLLDYKATHSCAAYEAGCPCRDENGRSDWRSATQMPIWASRITLAPVRRWIERAHDLTEQDILAEGVTVDMVARVTNTPWSDMPELYDARRVLWDHDHVGRSTWAENPWIESCEVEVVDVRGLE